jgi:hypothetical protein
MYRVYSLNPGAVAPPLSVNKMDEVSYLIPRSVFDSQLQSPGTQEEIKKMHHFYDTYSELDIKTKAVSFDEIAVPANACIRMEPCHGVAKELNLCCPNLFTTQSKSEVAEITNIEESWRLYMKQFDAGLSQLSFEPPGYKEKNTVAEQDLIVVKMEELKLRDSRRHVFMKWLFFMLIIVGILIATIALISFLVKTG